MKSHNDQVQNTTELKKCDGAGQVQKPVQKEETAEDREKYIELACRESGIDREVLEKEMDYAKEHGIKYRAYARKGYWNIPHDILLDAHKHGGRRRRIAKEIAKKRGRDHHSVEKEMIDAKYNLGLRIGYFKKYDWDLLTPEEKSQMLLRPHGFRMSAKYRLENADFMLLNDKKRFYEAFKDKIGRKWMEYDPDMSQEEFCEKIAGFKTENIFYKPKVSSGGKGIRRYILGNDPADLYQRLHDDDCGPALIEEELQQHPVMNSLCSDSINTIRAVSLYWEGEYRLFYTVCRMGAGEGKPVDNVSQGGMAISVDPQTGRFNTVAADHDGEAHTTHPATGVELIGFQVPYWPEVLKLVKDAAIFTFEQAGLGYTGWDVAITPDGPVLIEGNNRPSPSLIQLCNWLNSRKGMMYLFEPYLKP